MTESPTPRLLAVLLLALAGAHVAHGRELEDDAYLLERLGRTPSGEGEYINDFAVEVIGGERVAREVAQDLGFILEGKVGSLENHYSMSKKDHPSRSKRSAVDHTRSLNNDDRVSWARQQRQIYRYKRDYIESEVEKRAYAKIKFNDPYYKEQWYLYDQRKNTDAPKVDLHVVPVWDQGITGKGIAVSIIDDGLEHNHTDLVGNYYPDASYDFNEGDPDPFPRYDPSDENKHGTRCAGEVAMAANNKMCGVGVAYNAWIGGIRLLDGVVTDRKEAEALSYNIDKIDIFSASWGPNDDGMTVEGPGRLAQKAFEKGIKEGRNGKGIIYVWASGNGGTKGDNCNCDGYTSSIYTLSISSASQHLESPWYAERCASTLATAYSSGTTKEDKISSTDLKNKCTDKHTGTSASAPLAAGIFALVLEANGDLTWRDVQHLVIITSEPSPLEHNEGWTENGAGLRVNTRFGFGLLNAAALVKAANPKTWKTVPEKSVCVIDSKDTEGMGLPRTLTNGTEIVISIDTSGCKGQDNEIRYLEHVQVYLSMNYTHRGNIEIYLKSPASSKRTPLVSHRRNDASKSGYQNWPFMSVHQFGENPKGIWEVTIMDDMVNDANSGDVERISLVLHGTKEKPSYWDKDGNKGPRKYNDDYNNVQNTRESQEGTPAETLDEKIQKLRKYLTDPSKSLNNSNLITSQVIKSHGADNIISSEESSTPMNENDKTRQEMQELQQIIEGSYHEEHPPEDGQYKVKPNSSNTEDLKAIYGEDDFVNPPEYVVDPNPEDYLQIYSNLWEDKNNGEKDQQPLSKEEIIVSQETFNRMLAEEKGGKSRNSFEDTIKDQGALGQSDIHSAEKLGSSSATSQEVYDNAPAPYDTSKEGTKWSNDDSTEETIGFPDKNREKSYMNNEFNSLEKWIEKLYASKDPGMKQYSTGDNDRLLQNIYSRENSNSFPSSQEQQNYLGSYYIDDRIQNMPTYNDNEEY